MFESKRTYEDWNNSFKGKLYTFIWIIEIKIINFLKEHK